MYTEYERITHVNVHAYNTSAWLYVQCIHVQVYICTYYVWMYVCMYVHMYVAVWMLGWWVLTRIVLIRGLDSNLDGVVFKQNTTVFEVKELIAWLPPSCEGGLIQWLRWTESIHSSSVFSPSKNVYESFSVWWWRWLYSRRTGFWGWERRKWKCICTCVCVCACMRACVCVHACTVQHNRLVGKKL